MQSWLELGLTCTNSYRWVIFTVNFWLTECLTVIKGRFWGLIEFYLLMRIWSHSLIDGP